MEEDVPTSAGLSSFNLLDERKFFSALAPAAGMVVLDLGCGVGNYAIATAQHVGGTGRVYALDLWAEGIETLEVRAAIGRHANITARVCGAGEGLTVPDSSVDLCLMATVMHILVREKTADEIMAEVRRVIKPGGRVAVVEFHKKDEQPGPPSSWRLSPEELERIMAGYGFDCLETVDVGPHNYLALFRDRQ